MAEERSLTRGQKTYLKRIVNDFKENANSVLNEISEVQERLIKGGDDEPTLFEQFETTKEQIAGKKAEINSIYDAIFKPSPSGKKSMALQLQSFLEEFEHQKAAVTRMKTEIETFNDELFGGSDESGASDGIQDRIKGKISDLEKLYEQNREKQEHLFTKIEGLLKGASTVALAKAFKDHKDSFRIMNILWLVVFIIAILAMMGLSLFAFVYARFEFNEMWKYTLGNLPFLGGVVWLAIYASKQRSQNKRLQQEYAFKEDVAKIYYGLKKEIEELGDSPLGQKLNERVLEILVEVVSLNPSTTLESLSHNDRGPIMETLHILKDKLNDNYVRQNTK
ncbi:MAG: hypothetical protein WA913_15850 [Pricia sp.]